MGTKRSIALSLDEILVLNPIRRERTKYNETKTSTTIIARKDDDITSMPKSRDELIFFKLLHQYQ